MEVEAVNVAGARVGDQILLRVDTGAVLKVSFLLYVFPILLMLAGAVVGQVLAPSFDLNPSALSAVVGVGCFLMSFFLIRLTGNRLAKQKSYRPRVIRII
jgi:sigma-E factor negative regulatory protein RseC